MLELKNIKRSYKTGDFVQHALKGIDLSFRQNEFVAILGPSGSGKTTLLNIIGGLDRYDSGDLIINNKSTKKFSNTEWDAYRNNCIGFIFQSYNLITHISVLANVEMAMTLSGVSASKRKKKAIEVLTKVGLEKHIHKKPNQLSGGQMQRVAIARALANDPDIILADEPTGALDTKTSIQIMDLIKEISKDKLVIMVTHNPDLAKEYASRIVELKDGELVKDSNPIKEEEENKKKFSIKKTAMNFISALRLSFNNIKTKKGRTIITSLASSIGIIGIALILSLSNGFKLQIDKFEKETLSQMPIVVTPTVMTTDEEAQKQAMEQYMNKNNGNSFTDKKEIYPLISVDSLVHTNHITNEYIEYIENAKEGIIGAISYMHALKLNLLYKDNNKVNMLDQTTMMVALPETIDGKDSNIIKDNFELIYGKMPENSNELVILVDINNRLDASILKKLGFGDKEIINFDDIIGKEFKVVLNDDLYKRIEDNFVVNINLDELYDNENNITLKITGILRGVEGSKFAEYSGSGICYKEQLFKDVIEKNDKSKIVEKQKKVNYNVLTGEKIDEDTKETLLAALGAKAAPIMVQIYPSDFNSKDELTSYLDKYNDDKEDDDKIIYTDYAKTITSLSGNIMDAVTVVLIAFSAISLIVSSIMIGIIMYISVLERTKEIGILRALGARKKDITRVFNAETFIIGLFSGLLGISIAMLLCIPANIIIENLTDLKNVATLNPIHAIVLITISLLLTLIGGYIPAKLASKKNPVEALRTE